MVHSQRIASTEPAPETGTTQSTSESEQPYERQEIILLVSHAPITTKTKRHAKGKHITE